MALTLAACAGVDLRDYRAANTASGRVAQTWQELPVASGQIIVNEHPSGVSLFLSLIAARFAPYMHVGLVVVETDGPYVYEAMGAMLPLPWRTPNASVGGGVRRVRLEQFLARGGITALYEPPAIVDRKRLVEFARARRHEHKPFDGSYDSRDDSRYYCVEFVARALEAAGAAPIMPAPTTRNASMRVALDWLEIRTPVLLMAGELIDEQRRVALLSRRFSASEIARYFALKREIHRRFTADQRIGNVVYWSHQQLHMRPAVDRYFETGVSNSVDPAVLADEIFGPMRPEEGPQPAASIVAAGVGDR
jgi:hypothetical protein